jgi:hypothetical protein
MFRFLRNFSRLINPIRIRRHRQLKGLSHAIMMSLPAGAVTSGRQGCRGRLKRGVVSDVQLPVGAQTTGLRVTQITVNDAEESGDSFATGRMSFDPAVVFPIG